MLFESSHRLNLNNSKINKYILKNLFLILNYYFIKKNISFLLGEKKFIYKIFILIIFSNNEFVSKRNIKIFIIIIFTIFF